MCTYEGRRHQGLREPVAAQLIGWPGHPTADWLLIEHPVGADERDAAWSLWPAAWPLAHGHRVLAVLATEEGERS